MLQRLSVQSDFPSQHRPGASMPRPGDDELRAAESFLSAANASGFEGSHLYFPGNSRSRRPSANQTLPRPAAQSALSSTLSELLGRKPEVDGLLKAALQESGLQWRMPWLAESLLPESDETTSRKTPLSIFADMHSL